MDKTLLIAMEKLTLFHRLCTSVF